MTDHAYLVVKKFDCDTELITSNSDNKCDVVALRLIHDCVTRKCDCYYVVVVSISNKLLLLLNK